MSPELLLAILVVGVLAAYILFGGADFGAGVWDLLSTGPRRTEQRALIERAIGPIWEANHVWLIFAAVLLFSAFPSAFATVTTALHVPLTLFLIGIVFRGTAFVFRSYDPGRRRRWGAIFSMASIVSPVLLGICIGALSSGRIRVEGGAIVSGFFAPWMTAFALAVGLLTLAVCAFLAAVYLAREAPEGPLREDFRRRALLSTGGVAASGIAVLLLARTGAPRIFERLLLGPATAVVAAGLVAAVACWALLWRRRYGTARLLAGALVTFLIGGWAVAQYPYFVVPDVTIASAASNPATLRALVWAVAAGFPVLAPSLYLLFKVFKSPQQMPPPAGAPAAGGASTNDER